MFYNSFLTDYWWLGFGRKKYGDNTEDYDNFDELWHAYLSLPDEDGWEEAHCAYKENNGKRTRKINKIK